MLKAFLTNRITWALTGLLVLAVLLPIGLGRSQAAFVAHSGNQGSVFSSAATFNTVAVTLTNPGTPLRGTVMLNAVATSDRGVSSVVFETSPAGANTWTTVCSDNVSPYSCSWNTTSVTDGLRDIRAVATDTAGYTRTDTVTNRLVDNTGPSATTTDPGSPLTGVVSVTGVGSDAGSGVASTTVQYRPSGGGSWTGICTQTSATATCSWNTASLADGLYDLRTVSTDVAGNAGTPSAVVSNRLLDNIAPTATMTAPATNLNGFVTLQSTSADGANGTGVASVRYEYKLSSGSTWLTACTGGATPFSCSFNTGSVSDGLYDFRAVATDGVNKTGTSAPVSSRKIDNTGPAATMGALATNLSGSVSLTSTLNDGAGVGVASAQYQYKLTSDSTWTNTCSSATTPYSCPLNTASLTDGLYDFRVVAADTLGNTGTSTAVFSRRVDNTGATATTTDPGSPLTGVVSVTGVGSDAGSGVASTTVQYRPNGGGSWTNICTQTSATATCSWTTASLADGLYDLRTVAADVVGNPGIPSAIVSNRLLDNIAPTATMTAPAVNLNGSVTLQSTSADGANGTGVASVRYEYRTNPAGAWNTACTGGATPFSCSFNTGSVSDGLYDFRAVAIDGVNKTGPSAAVLSRKIDNTAPTATMGALGANVSGSVLLTSTLSDGAGVGVASAQYQYKLTSDSTWTNTCSSSTTPYSCSLNTASLTDGLYDFRVVAADTLGNSGASTPVFSRRIDNTNPTVTMGALPAWVDGTITLTSTPADGGGIASVRYEYRTSPAGAWTFACTGAASPYSCSFSTTGLANLTAYDFRAIATDNATPGRTGTSGTVTTRIDRTNPTVTMTSPAANLAGSVTLASTTADTGSGVASVQYQYRLGVAGAWSNACSSSGTPFSCVFDTTSVADGVYSFQAIVTDNVGHSITSLAVTNRRIDNTNPITSTLVVPAGANLSGNLNFTGTAADNGGGSGVASWRVQASPTGTGTWTDICPDTSGPFATTSCTGSVDGLADGIYDFRAVVTDLAGNTLASALVTNRRVDTDGPVTSVTTPASGTRVSGTVTLTAAATDPVGVASVQFQVFLFGAWTTFCTDTSPSYSCSGDSTAVADGTYQVRVVATDTLTHVTYSTPTTLIIDNTDPSATGINTTNGGTAGRIDTNDTIAFTWSEPMAPASILAGWNGGSQPIEVRVTNSGNNDLIDLYSTGGAHLNITEGNLLETNANYVSANVTYNATMVMTGNSVTVTLGSQVGTGGLNTVNTGTPDLEWDSANETTDVAGNPATGNIAVEAGNDVDF